MTHHIPILIELDEDGVFIVSAPTIPGCHSYGYTLDEAMQNLSEAAALCLEGTPPNGGLRFVGIRDLELAL